MDRLHELARRHVPGSGPVDITLLQTGVVNASYRVLRDGGCYALRVGNAATAELGMDREWERRVLQQVSRARIAPDVEVCVPSEAVLVTRWVTGTTWSEDEAGSPRATELITQLMRRIHAVRAPVLARAMTPVRWIEFYRKALTGYALDAGTAGALSTLGERSRLQQQIYQRLGPRAATLCHSDLHRLNLLESDAGMTVLDWEYAHVGDPFWDLAGWITMNDGVPAETLMRLYLGRSPMQDEYRRLDVLTWFFDYVGFLWCHLYACTRGSGASAEILQRARVLEARLSTA